MSHKPAGMVYGADDRLPLSVNLLSGLQHVGLMSISLVYPVLVARAAGATAEVAAALVSATLVAMAIGAVLQVGRFGPVGSGYLCQPMPSVIYLVPSLLAARVGGIPAVLGMTIFAGLLQVGLARLLPRLRVLLTSEIAGLVVLLAGIAVGVLGVRLAFSGGQAGASAVPAEGELRLALLTLAVMVALNVWGKGAWRLYSVLIGLAVGSLAGWADGQIDPADWALLAAAPALSAPAWGHLAWDFERSLVLPFAVAALAGVLKVIGNVTTLQKDNDPAWVRLDMRSVSGGVFAEGLGSVVAGGVGAPGISSSSGAVGLASATGVSSRWVGASIAIILLVFAFVPRLGMLFNVVPRPVLGAALAFSATFIVVNGMVIITSRLLDMRRTLAIGMAIVLGLAVELFPDLLAALPEALRPAVGSTLVMGTLVGLALTLLFRIGVRRTVSMTVPANGVNAQALQDFLATHGAAWGARADVIERVKFNLVQSIETLVSAGVASGPLQIEASFDEFNLDLRVSYAGEQLALPEERPSLDEIVAAGDGERRLAGYLLRRFADRVSSRRSGERSTITFHFDH